MKITGCLEDKTVLEIPGDVQGVLDELSLTVEGILLEGIASDKRYDKPPQLRAQYDSSHKVLTLSGLNCMIRVGGFEKINYRTFAVSACSSSVGYSHKDKNIHIYIDLSTNLQTVPGLLSVPNNRENETERWPGYPFL